MNRLPYIEMACIRNKLRVPNPVRFIRIVYGKALRLIQQRPSSLICLLFLSSNIGYLKNRKYETLIIVVNNAHSLSLGITLVAQLNGADFPHFWHSIHDMILILDPIKNVEIGRSSRFQCMKQREAVHSYRNIFYFSIRIDKIYLKVRLSFRLTFASTILRPPSHHVVYRQVQILWLHWIRQTQSFSSDKDCLHGPKHF